VIREVSSAMVAFCAAVSTVSPLSAADPAGSIALVRQSP
jgi:hypothetical protein